MTPRTTTPDLSGKDPNWWRQAVVYQVYPRSFADADGDGLGDLGGVTERLGHLAALGADALWLSPFYPSELADGGYDVADYRDVDPRLGTLDDFDALVAEAHRLGLKVIVDLVPNHTSHQHAWFQEALRRRPRLRQPARGTSSGTAAARTANSRPPTGSPSSAAAPGGGCRTGSGTCICSPPSSPTSTGPMRRSARTSAPPCGSGRTAGSTASGWTWRTRWSRT
ncbi:Alpha-1,4-glucan:maltose-1-phosphate maltosyltransferase [Streptomyces alboniger]